MLQNDSERQPSTFVRLFFLAALVGVLGGCAALPAGQRAHGASQPIDDKNRARLEVDRGFGFTVTEVVRIRSDVRADYESAVAMLRRDQLDEGITLLESVVQRAPELTAPHIDLGVAYGRIGAQDEAQRSLQSALALAPNHPVALNELGIVYRRTGNFESARTSYERALDIHPSYHFALRNLGVLCDLYLEDMECALRHYESYAEIVTDDKQVSIWIADIKNRMAVGR